MRRDVFLAASNERGAERPVVAAPPPSQRETRPPESRSPALTASSFISGGATLSLGNFSVATSGAPSGGGSGGGVLSQCQGALSPKVGDTSFRRIAERTAPSDARGSAPLGEVMDWLENADLAGLWPVASIGMTPPSHSHGSYQELRAPSNMHGIGMDEESLIHKSLPPRRRYPPTPSGAAWAPCQPNCCEVDRLPDDELTSEEEEWYARQRLTGAIGRIVRYIPGDRPSEDIGLRGGGASRVMVAAVRDGGPASRSGVTAGDELISINGGKDFTGRRARDVQASLRAPSTLVFLGFVGKLQAEVRLNFVDAPCGLSTREQVTKSKLGASLSVHDEVIFQPGTAPLLLVTNPVHQAELKSSESSATPGCSAEAQAIYELTRRNARNLVFPFEDEDFDDDRKTPWLQQQFCSAIASSF